LLVLLLTGLLGGSIAFGLLLTYGLGTAMIAATIGGAFFICLAGTWMAYAAAGHGLFVTSQNPHNIKAFSARPAEKIEHCPDHLEPTNRPAV
jgi:hypothetical protein